MWKVQNLTIVVTVKLTIFLQLNFAHLDLPQNSPSFLQNQPSFTVAISHCKLTVSQGQNDKICHNDRSKYTK